MNVISRCIIIFQLFPKKSSFDLTVFRVSLLYEVLLLVHLCPPKCMVWLNIRSGRNTCGSIELEIVKLNLIISNFSYHVMTPP